MSSLDPRAYYHRLSIPFFTTETVSQEFLDQRPIVKSSEGDEVTYYTEADGLTYEAAMRLYRPTSVRIVREYKTVKPKSYGTLDEWDTLPAAATHVVFALTSPVLQPAELQSLTDTVRTKGIELREVIIPHNQISAYFNDAPSD